MTFRIGEGEEIFLTVERHAITPMDQAAATAFNAASRCGITSWRAYEETDVIGKPCVGEHYTLGQLIRTTYQKRGDKLTLDGVELTRQ